MNLLRPLLRKSEFRYTLTDYAQTVGQMFGYGSFGYQGTQYPYGVTFSQPGAKIQPIGENFQQYVTQGLRGNSVVGTLELVRVQVFSQARFQFRRLVAGRPGALFGTPALAPLETPDGGTNSSLLGQMLLDADMAGSSYGCLLEGRVHQLRPDWVDTVVEPVSTDRGEVGYRTYGYLFWPDGERGGGARPTALLPKEVAHFTAMRDPLAPWRGMSWVTPVLRDILGDKAYTNHKLTYMANAATPNLAVKLDAALTPEQFDAFVDRMDAAHKGPANAGKTLYLGGGADVTVVGANMAELDFKAVQGAAETRLAAASGVGAVIAQFSEGMQGSSLNAGNYVASRRRFADITMRHLWQEATAALSTLIAVPRGSQLWYDDRDISFLQEDAKDAAEIDQIRASTIRQLVDGGFEPDAVVAAVWPDAQLPHSGKLSVQLQETGEPAALEPAPEEEPTNE